MKSRSLPLRQRRLDWFFVGAFAIFFIVVFVSDIASIMVPSFVDMSAVRADPPWWPPLPVIEALAGYAAQYDRLVLENPPFFQAIMWGDVIFLGPYYAFGIYAFVRGRHWIRIPTFLYAGHTLSYALILIWVQVTGPQASPHPAFALAAYAPFWIVPVLACWRVRRHRPFDEALVT